jgi:hypothetical protein
LASASPSSLRSNTRTISTYNKAAEQCFIAYKESSYKLCNVYKECSYKECHGSLILGHSVVDQESSPDPVGFGIFCPSGTGTGGTGSGFSVGSGPDKKWNDESSHRQQHTIFRVKNQKMR